MVLARSDTMADPMNHSGRRRFRRVTTCKANSSLICATHQTKPDMLRHHMSCLRTKNSGQGIQRALYHELPLVPFIYIYCKLEPLQALPFDTFFKDETSDHHYHPLSEGKSTIIQWHSEGCQWMKSVFDSLAGSKNILASKIGSVE